MIKKTWSGLSVGVKASVVYFLASMVSAGMAYITTPIYTRMLSPEEFGKVSVYLTWKSVFGVIAMFCLQSGVFNNGMLDYKDDRDGYSLSMLMLSNIITVVFGAIIFALYPFIGKWVDIDLPFLAVMFAVFLVEPAYTFFICRKRYEFKYKPTFVACVIAGLVPSLITVTCVLATKENKMDARILAMAFSQIVIFGVFYAYLVVKGKGKVKLSYWKFAFLFNLPLIPHYLSGYLLGNSSKILISHLIGDSQTAFYSIALTVGNIGIVVWSAINSSLVPFTYERCREKDYKSISKVTIPILFVFAAVSVLEVIFAPEIVAVLGTAAYREAIYAIPPIVGGVFFQVFYYIFANIVYYYKKPHYVMFASVTAVIISFALHFLLVPKFGYLVAGYITMFAYLVQACLDYLAMKKVVPEKIYNEKLLILLGLAVTLFVIGSNWIMEYRLVRYGILGVLLAVAVGCRRKIIDIVRMLKNK